MRLAGSDLDPIKATAFVTGQQFSWRSTQKCKHTLFLKWVGFRGLPEDFDIYSTIMEEKYIAVGDHRRINPRFFWEFGLTLSDGM